MKKIMTLMLVVLTTSIFAADWYSTKELMTDLKPMEFSKDTAWYGYGSPAWGWGLTEERATFYNLEDFGFEYPVTLHGMTSYLLDNGNDYSYIIYDKDGVTVLFQTAESTAFEGYNDYYFSPDSLILFDDFYMAIVPAVAGGPGAVTS
ncbi:MAG: hypothetical protein KAH33_06190, partial [Candidatus Delongbacteria bacterium]|nr:hypothetical protein [Candidatus Delongbacteria bacterium]